jgi:hypothetical protein
MITLEQTQKILLDNGEQYTEEELKLIYESLKASVRIIVQITKDEEESCSILPGKY